MPEAFAAALHVDLVLLGVPAADRASAFAAIARALAVRGLIESTSSICAAVDERERTHSTAWGGGVAVPHARVAGLPRSLVAIARLSAPIDFGAIDGRPVDLLVLVLSPADEPAEHVRLLSRLARRLRDPRICQMVRAAPTESAARAAIEIE